MEENNIIEEIEMEEEIEITEKQIEALNKELAKVKEETRKGYGLLSIKSKRLPNYIKRSIKNKEWMTGDALGETTVAK